jgi:hypothetical protein
MNTELTLHAIATDREAEAMRLVRAREARGQADRPMPPAEPARRLISALRDVIFVARERRPA